MYHIIVNPVSRSGRGAQIWHSLLPVMEAKRVSCEVHFTTGIGSGKAIAASLTENLADMETLTLIVLGGDGTINEVIQGIPDFDRVRIAYIPTGSSNDLARALQIERSPQKALLHILDNPDYVNLDIGSVHYENGFRRKSNVPIEENETIRYFAVSCGIGFDAAVCEEALSSKIKNILNKLRLGKLTYVSIALKQIIRAKSISCDICLDDNQTIHLRRFLFIAAMVHPYEGGGLKFCPDADPTDQLLDVIVAGDISKLKALRILPTAFQGKHLRFDGVNAYRAKSIRITTAAPLFVHTDGEVSIASSSIRLTICEKQIQFIK